MPDIKLNPYIGRAGDARDILEFYKEVLGGKLDVQTYGSTPTPVPDSHKDKLMHGMLESEGMTIMASDSPPDMPLSSTHSNIALSLSGPEEAKLKKIFEALADGGTVTMKLEKQFWGDQFGMVDDKFGTHWMVNIDSGEQGKAD